MPIDLPAMMNRIVPPSFSIHCNRSGEVQPMRREHCIDQGFGDGQITDQWVIDERLDGWQALARYRRLHR